MKIVKTKIRETKHSNIISQYWQGKCPACTELVKVYLPYEFIDWKAAYDEIDARYEALKEYTYEYSLFLQKQTGKYPENEYLKECLTNMLDRLTKFNGHINFDRFKDGDNFSD